MNNLELAEIERRIYSIRGVRVILDADLAPLYGVSTKRLNEQFRRNRRRFPDDFAFETRSLPSFTRSYPCRFTFYVAHPIRSIQLTAEEAISLRSQFATASKESSILRSQIATSSSHGGRRYRPYAFTEHGAIMGLDRGIPARLRFSICSVIFFCHETGR